jgi:serine protease Do
MATAVNPIELPGISFGDRVAALAETLRRSTVRISSRNGCGSGVIWRPDGLIVTNAHVVRSPKQQVKLWDGREIEGWVTARDDRRDLAVVMIPAQAKRGIDLLPVVTIRDARTLRTGEVVIAVGNPMGESGAVSVGVVHHPPCNGQHLIAADVKLAPGNSGGPLADAEGRIVGINTLVASGLGCAITSNAVAEFLRSSVGGETV